MFLKRITPICLLAIFLLTACARPATPTVTAFYPEPVSNQSAAYPDPNANALSAYPVPTVESGAVAPGTTPPTATAVGVPGNVTGILLSRETGQPMPDAVVRLAEVTRQSGQGMFVLDASRSPAARTDADGAFKFLNVSPAEYVLAYQVAEGIYSVAKDNKGILLTWVVEPGRTKDFQNVKVATKIP